MAIKIYCEYEEFICNEKELAEYFEDEAFLENDYDDYLDDESEIKELIGASSRNSSIREDADFYIVCDLENEEIAEEIASTLGRYTKINLKDYPKIIFYLA